MYANNAFLCGMWERAVRDSIGPAGTVRAIRGFRMPAFNHAGVTTVVRGRVASVDRATREVTLDLVSESAGRVTVGPGTVVVTLPAGPPPGGPAAGD